MLAVTYYLIPGLLVVQLAMGRSIYFSRIVGRRSSCHADVEEPWSYRGQNGPAFWGQTYPVCNKYEQSPIDIETWAVEKDSKLAKLVMMNYNSPITKASIKNNGHTVELTPEDSKVRSITIGGSTYTFRQLHFHWGDCNHKGAEHTLNGVQHALEMHLVHMNEKNQIAVVGVIFREQRAGNNELQKIVKVLPKLLYKDTETELTDNLNLNYLLPENPASYYRYRGSLTTPGCAEGVTWSVLTNLLTVSSRQMAEFRKLYSARREEALPTCKLSNNYRPIQRLNGRTVYVSQ